jgi:hypothetical protein
MLLSLFLSLSCLLPFQFGLPKGLTSFVTQLLYF